MSDLISAVESKWNALNRVDKLMVLNGAGIDFIEVGMESYPNIEDYHTNSAYQTLLSQKLNEFAGKKFNSLPISIQQRVTEVFRDQDIVTEADDEDGNFDMEGELDDNYKDSEGNSFDYVDTDKEVEDDEKATEAYHYSLQKHISPEGLSLKNLKKAKEIMKDETDEFYDKFFDIIGEVEYPYKEDIPVTRPDNPIPTGQYNDNPNKGLYDTKQFTRGGANTRIGEVMSEQDVLENFEPDEFDNATCSLCGLRDINPSIDNLRDHLYDKHGINYAKEIRNQDTCPECGRDGLDHWDYGKKTCSSCGYSGEAFTDYNEIDREKEITDRGNSENTKKDDYNKYDQMEFDDVKETEYSDEPESEDAKIAKVEEFEVPETNTNEIDKKKDEGGLDEWKEEAEEEGKVSPELGDTYDKKSEDTYEAKEVMNINTYSSYEEAKADGNEQPVVDEETGRWYSSNASWMNAHGGATEPVVVDGKLYMDGIPQAYEAKLKKTKGSEAVIPYSQENEIQRKIVERKLAGYPDHSIAREVAIWHDLSTEDALQQVQAVEVGTDDKTAYSLFGKRLNELNRFELGEMKTLCGEVRKPEEEK